MNTQEKTYKPRAKDKGSYHLLLREGYFDKETGEWKGREFVQMFGTKKIKERMHHLKQQGYDIEVLYDPTQEQTGGTRSTK